MIYFVDYDFEHLLHTLYVVRIKACFLVYEAYDYREESNITLKYY